MIFGKKQTYKVYEIVIGCGLSLCPNLTTNLLLRCVFLDIEYLPEYITCFLQHIKRVLTIPKNPVIYNYNYNKNNNNS